MILTPGSPEALGVTPDARGANVAVFSRHASAIELCLFDETGTQETACIALPERTGDIHHAHVAGLKPGARYGLRAHGPHDPANGHRFNPHKLLVDPHALLLDRPFTLHPAMFGYREGDPDGRETTDSAPFMPKAIVPGPDAAAPVCRPAIPWSQTSLYEVHVRGFTREHPEVPAQWRGTFAGLGHPAIIEYFQKLGITTLELMPAAAWNDERHLIPLGLSNIWGYNPVAFGAPDPRLAPGGWAEIRAAVAAFQAGGIEVLLDVVLNHSGEGDELGPTLSLRGLDNASYYRLDPQDARKYINDAGCGNILALDRAPVVRLAMDSLRVWAQKAGLDGFRFDLATTLGRRDSGFDPEAPLLSAISQDPVLRGLKLVAEPWDVGPGGYQPGKFPAGWGEWNDTCRDDIRRFWRGDGRMLGQLATRLAGSAGMFAAKHRPSRGINFITAHDGFTLHDLVSHSYKHNEANGEHNRDGTDANYSWTHGGEGPVDDLAINALRLRDQRNLIATLFLSRGTPMLSMGSERGHTQNGNNNAYAQDIALDWSCGDFGLTDFVAAMTRLRQHYRALTEDRFLDGSVRDGQPDVQWLRSDAASVTPGDWDSGDSRALMVVLATAGERVLLVFHAGFEPRSITLPLCREGYCWHLALDTAALEPLAQPIALGAAQVRMEVAARSVLMLAERV